MPSYTKVNLSIYSDVESGAKEIDKFDVSTRPLGFRKILRFWPYITGSKPRFNFNVKRLSDKTGIGYNVTLYRSHLRGNDIAENEVIFFSDMGDTIKQEQYESNVEDEMIGTSGEYSYELQIQVGVWSEKVKIVTFKALAQEDITLTILALIAGFIISLITWLITRGS